MYTISSILEAITSINLSISDPQLEIRTLDYDSRKIRQGEYSLFFALKNVRDGHLFVDDAYHKNVRNFVVSDHDLDVTAYIGANFIWVDDTLHALQQLAAYNRNQSAIPVIGITGSNGKTIVKEWLNNLLAFDLRCYQSPKSYNSQLGVALSLWDIQPDHQIALIEAGISTSGEMANLAKMIHPTVGILTSLGSAHDDGFASEREKIAEKWKLFEDVSLIIAPSVFVPQEYRDERCFLWGHDPNDKVYIEGTECLEEQTLVHIRTAGLRDTLAISFTDKASVDNVMTCVTVLLAMGYEMRLIQDRIAVLQPLEMRLKLKKGKNNCSIIDDSYSNDIASLQIALDFMQQQNQHAVKSLVLTDFVGVGWDDRFRDKLLAVLNTAKLDKIVLIGDRIAAIADHLQAKTFVFPTTESFLFSLTQIGFNDETILIKGARKFGLERLSQLLVQKTHDTVLEINLKSIEHNLSQYRSRIEPGVKLMVMVKAFSYGSGSFEVANVLQFNNVDYLTVAFVDEGVELRQGGIRLPIMVMSPHEDTFDDLLKYNLEPEIYSMRILRAFVGFLEKKQVMDYPIHIKMDTGMHRLGFMPEEMDVLLAVLLDTQKVKVQSVFSHLVGAGNKDLDMFTDDQIRVFRQSADKLEKELHYTVIKHICNTNGIIYRPQDHMDMVRLGIGLYGVDTAPKDLKLQEVGTLKTTISQIKTLSAGETVGYDRKGVLYRSSTIATVKIGYADGYDRRLGNGVGRMMVNGHLVPTVGNICMDMCMLDITDVAAVEGQEVWVFPDIVQAAKDIGTIPYELLTGVSSRVKRVYYYE